MMRLRRAPSSCLSRGKLKKIGDCPQPGKFRFCDHDRSTEPWSQTPKPCPGLPIRSNSSTPARRRPCSRRRRFVRTPGSVQFYSARRMEAPRTVDDVFDNFSARRDGLIKALTIGARSHRLARLGTSPGGPKPARGREIYKQTFAFPVAIGSRRAGTRGYPPASEAAFAARASIVSLTQILAHLR